VRLSDKICWYNSIPHAVPPEFASEIRYSLEMKAARRKVELNSTLPKFEEKSSLPFLIFLLAYAYLVTFSFHYSKFTANSDAYVGDALAKSIIENQSFMPKEFAYANGDFLVYYHHTFLIFIRFFSTNTQFAHGLASLFLATIFLFAIFVFVRQLNASFNRSFYILAFVSTGISLPIADWFFTQAGYATLCSLILFFFANFLKFYFNPGFIHSKKLRVSDLLSMCLPLGMILLTNPLRFIMIFLFPFLFAIPFIGASPQESVDNFLRLLKSSYKAITFIFIPFIALRLLFETQATSKSGITGSGFRTLDGFNEGLKNTFLGFFQLLGLFPEANIPLVSSSGLIAIIRFCSLILLLVLLRKLINSEILPQKVRFLWKFSISGFLIQIFFLAVTNISIDVNSGRYLLIHTFIILLVILASTDYTFMINTIFTKILSFVLLFAFAFSSALMSISVDQSDFVSRLKLIENLKQIGITQVNATYWHSAKNQFISNDEITFNTVYLDPNICYQEYWWVNETKPLDDSLPLVLTLAESDYINLIPNCHERLRSLQTLRVGNYIVYYSKG
jgi:hypothetical protein